MIKESIQEDDIILIYIHVPNKRDAMIVFLTLSFKLNHQESWALKNWCFWIVVLEKILESPLDCEEIKPVNSKGNQSWIFIGRTAAEAPVLWPHDEKSWLISKDPDAGKDWRQEGKWVAEYDMVW